MESKIIKRWVTDNATHVSAVSLFSLQGSRIFIGTDTVWCLNFSWKCCILDTFLSLKWGVGVWSLWMMFVTERVLLRARLQGTRQLPQGHSAPLFSSGCVLGSLVEFLAQLLDRCPQWSQSQDCFQVFWLVWFLRKPFSLSVPIWEITVLSTTSLKGEMNSYIALIAPILIALYNNSVLPNPRIFLI